MRLVARNTNWGLSGPGDWAYTDYILYTNRKLKVSQFRRGEYIDNLVLDEKESGITEFSKEQCDFIYHLIDIERNKKETKLVPACDGDSWEFRLYDGKKLIWKYDQYYIYHSKELMKVAQVLTASHINVIA